MFNRSADIRVFCVQIYIYKLMLLRSDRAISSKSGWAKKLTRKLCEGTIEADPFAFLDFIRLQNNDLPTGFLNTARIVNLGVSTITSSLRAEIGQMYTVMRYIRYSEYLQGYNQLYYQIWAEDGAKFYLGVIKILPISDSTFISTTWCPHASVYVCEFNVSRVWIVFVFLNCNCISRATFSSR